MKDIYSILTGLGIEVPDDKKEALDKEWKANYKTVAEFQKVQSKRDSLQASLDEVNAKLSEFDGVNVDELKGQIEGLKADLETQKHDYEAKEADRIFRDGIKSAITDAKGKNHKAIMSLLDLDAIKASKNQKEDITAAINKVKESDAYLFGSDEPIKNPVSPTGPSGSGNDGLSAIRAAMGLPAK